MRCLRLKGDFFEVLEDTLCKQIGAPAGVLDYFSWGRDPRHVVDDSEDVKFNNKKSASKRQIKRAKGFLLSSYYKIRQKTRLGNSKGLRRRFSNFEDSFRALSDDESRQLFCELLLMQVFGEKVIRLSSFTDRFISGYEESSGEILESAEEFPMYKWILKKIVIDDADLALYTEPTILNCINQGRCYRYNEGPVKVGVEYGDVVIDAGVGWGDTTVFLASLAGAVDGGHVYSFDILETAFEALDAQLKLNPNLNNVTKVKRALSSADDVVFYTTEPSPGARIVDYKTPYQTTSITIDAFVSSHRLQNVDFIKMDIEGAEREALIGASKTIREFKPKLAISVYHLKDDLEVIPMIIKNIRSDYEMYLDCTTGFGGETVLFAK